MGSEISEIVECQNGRVQGEVRERDDQGVQERQRGSRSGDQSVGAIKVVGSVGIAGG